MKNKIFYLLFNINTSSNNFINLKKEQYIGGITFGSIIVCIIYILKKKEQPIKIYKSNSINNNQQQKIEILYSEEDKTNMNINFNEFLYNTHEKSFENVFKKFYENKSLRDDFKNKINNLVNGNNINDSEFLFKYDKNENIHYVINYKKSPVKIPVKYNENNIFYNIIHYGGKANIIYENDSILIIENKGTKRGNNEHFLLIPKNNYITYVDFFQKASDSEIKDFFKALYDFFHMYNLDEYFKSISKQYTCLYINHANGIFNNVRGIHFHQSIHHLHLHIYLPYIYKNSKINFKIIKKQ